MNTTNGSEKMNLKELVQLVTENCAEPDKVEIVLDGTLGYCTPNIEIVSALIATGDLLDGVIAYDEGQEETPVNRRRKVILIS